MRKEITIAVVIATYNGEKFLKEQIDSILNQTLPPNEIICFDDGSTDNTWQILEGYSATHPDIFRIYKGEPTGTPDLNFKRAFQKVSSEIIFPSDQDDIWKPNKIETLLSSISDNVDIVFAQDDVLYENGDIKYDDCWSILPPHKMLFRGFLKGHTCAFRSCLVPLYQSAYSNNHGICWDGVLSYYGTFTGRIKSIPDALTLWRRHEGAVTFSAFNSKTQEVPSNKNYSKWHAFKETNKLLSSGFHSKAISLSMDARYSLIKFLADNYSLDIPKNEIRELLNICRGLSRQTMFSILIAGVNNMRLYWTVKENENETVRTRLAGWLYSFREPYNWFYNYHKEKHLS